MYYEGDGEEAGSHKRVMICAFMQVVTSPYPYLDTVGGSTFCFSLNVCLACGFLV